MGSSLVPSRRSRVIGSLWDTYSCTGLAVGFAILAFHNSIILIKPNQEFPKVSRRARLQESPFHKLGFARDLFKGHAFVLTVAEPTVAALHLHRARWARRGCLGPELGHHVTVRVLVVARRDIQAPIGVLSRGLGATIAMWARPFP